MTGALEGLLLAEDTVAALRLASTRRTSGGALDTHTVLIALVATDRLGSWDRLLIDEGHRPDPAGPGFERWQGVPLTDRCAAALRRCRTIADAYGLIPVSP